MAAKSTPEAAPVTLSKVCERAFSLILTLVQGRDFGDVQQLRANVGSMFAAIERDARVAAIPTEDILSARFALTAFIDEAIARSDWFGKRDWAQRPLALEYFSTNNAGDEFFDRLDELRLRPEVKVGVLEVYYTCLALGFEGKSALADPRQSRALIESLGRDLERIRGRVLELSPHWVPPDQLMERVKRELPVWAVTLACVVVLFVIFVVLNFLSHSNAEEAKRSLSHLEQGPVSQGMVESDEPHSTAA
jgi:type VI secretion system protein ImpK